MTQRPCPRLVVLLSCALLAAIAPRLRADETPPSPLQLERAIMRAFDRGDYDRAATFIEESLEARPGDPRMLYNLACAYCRGGRLDDATSALYRSVKAGFSDFTHMEADPDLAAIRDRELYRAIVEASRRLSARRAESALARWKRRFGTDAYRYEVDHDRRLAFATALDEVSHGQMRQMLQREADQLIETLFEAPPSYYVLVAVPTPEDAVELFGSADNVGGRYEHGRHRLIARDIGGTLRHEFVHALHYGHMERLGLSTPHPLWIQEGLAALYEDYERADDGTFRFLPNERTNIVKNRARSGRLTRWTDFFAMPAERFMAAPGRNYPQARSIFAFLADEGKLTAWYRAYLEHYADDRSGTEAFEAVFDRPLENVERQWRRWVERRPAVDHSIRYGDAALGIRSDINDSNDGILIARVLPNSAASRGRLRPGDVIVAVDERPVRSLMELQKLIGAKRVGDRVAVRVRRRDRYFTREVVLRPIE